MLQYGIADSSERVQVVARYFDLQRACKGQQGGPAELVLHTGLAGQMRAHGIHHRILGVATGASRHFYAQRTCVVAGVDGVRIETVARTRNRIVEFDAFDTGNDGLRALNGAIGL